MKNLIGKSLFFEILRNVNNKLYVVKKSVQNFFTVQFKSDCIWLFKLIEYFNNWPGREGPQLTKVIN